MWLDAVLAYLHFTAVFVLFAFLTVEVVLARASLDAAAARLLRRVDLWYFGAAMVTLATGISRAIWGAKGWAFYAGDWVFHAKVTAFLAVAALSVPPTLAIRRWCRHAAAQEAFVVPEDERRRLRRYLMWEVHVAAMIPVFAVVMARGLGR
jgi:putative membrane protein